MSTFFTRKRVSLLVISSVLIIAYIYSLPGKLFEDPLCTVLLDRQGQLLSASIASDGQWRFPELKTVPEKFTKAIVSFEDKRFFGHPGVDVLALSRAVRQNIRSGRIVSGGSTLTMQLVRLSGKNPPRTLYQKFVEVILATRIEFRYSKEEIMALYASHAPFGGNVVGIEAACWRFFGRSSQDLSWGEAALLAVLPNNPSLIHLSRQREVLKAKRDKLLEKLMREGVIENLDYQLAVAEPLPERPQALPALAPHALNRLKLNGHAEQIISSTLDQGLQERVSQTLDDYFQRIKANQIFNAAVLILRVETGEVIAYAGNTPAGQDHHEDVDIIRSLRSTGSILKPFLYAAMLDEGKILPRTLIPDVPTTIGGFAPKNFSRQHDGMVNADQALIRSLNIPAVMELRDYRYEKFYSLLQNMGMTSLKKPADHYGLSLVLGGAEGTLWDITGMYASCGRTLNNYFERPGKKKYDRSDFHSPVLIRDSVYHIGNNVEESSYLSASSLWITFETLKELYRPGEETGWQHFNSSKPVAWKTGTSFGFRDGWAIGLNPEYVVGVWVGNADGEGRPGLTGTEAAAPLMFNIFSFLPSHEWFRKPASELKDIPVCSQSGQRFSVNCEKADTVSVPLAGLNSASCQYHQVVHLSGDEKFRVHDECEPVDKIKNRRWFVLPPVAEYYFKSRNLGYRPLPPYRRDCADPSAVVSMGLIYPKPNSEIYVPVQLDGVKGQTIFEATHRNTSAVVYWHLDGVYLGSTKSIHRMAMRPNTGKHNLTLMDDSGELLQRQFEVISGR